MDIQSTLVIVKPDGVRRRLVGEVISRLEKKGLDIKAMRMLTMDRELAERHYGVHRDKPFFPELVEFITSGPVVVMQVSGHRAIEAVRNMMGATDPVAAAPGSLRGDYGLVITENLVHGSDGPDTAKNEIALFFG